jgi:hypothetical protein
MELSLCLYYADNLPDSMKGRRAYLDYLMWLKSDSKAKRQIDSSRLCRGWALGGKHFKEELVDKFLPVGRAGHLEGKDLSEANEIRWSLILKRCLSIVEKDKQDIQQDKKSADWKVLVALFMKDHTSVPNTWLAKHLNMGVPHGVSRYTAKLANSKGRKHKKYLEIARITE